MWNENIYFWTIQLQHKYCEMSQQYFFWWKNYLFISISFYLNTFLSQYIFIEIHFYRNTFLSKYIFIEIHFYRNIVRQNVSCEKGLRKTLLVHRNSNHIPSMVVWLTKSTTTTCLRQVHKICITFRPFYEALYDFYKVYLQPPMWWFKNNF